MWTLLKIFLLPLICSSAIFSQTLSYGTISGTIHDEDTGEPVYFVNVFLANTTLGVASDENGYFMIENIPPGDYDIVFSHIGYEVQIMPTEITFNEYIVTDMDIRLKSRVLKGEEITIETEEPREWRKNLERFTHIFIGNTDNARSCTILNPEILDFQVDPETDVMTASSEYVIKVENQALGYYVDIVLVEFEGITEDAGLYTIYPYFQEMEPENDRELQIWIDNRYKTYQGSLKHFLSSLVLDCIEENEFYTFKPRFGKTGYTTSRLIESDLIESILVDSIRFIKRCTCDGDLLVQYSLDDRFVSSFEITDQYVDVDSFGHNLTPYSLNVGGYWATLRVADTLPRYYKPQK